MNFLVYKDELELNGFTVIRDIFTDNEIEAIAQTINNADSNTETFRKSADLFAIRQFLKEIPKAKTHVLNTKLKEVIYQLFGENYFAVKSIYFDKPGNSNWFVAYHQDLTISVNQKTESNGYGAWTIKQNQFAVQPPIEILENIYTVRIHLDDTDENNGALKVVPNSHIKKIYRPETIDWTVETEITCNIPKGGIMIMKPLLLHGSGRTNNNKNRRVVHIEFSDAELPKPLQWSERMSIN